jgi:hypothetical protein
MAAPVKLPDLAYVSKHFQDLVGRRVNGVIASQRLKTGTADRWLAAWYELEDHRIVGVICVDLTLASYLSAAFSLVPAAQATAMAKSGQLDKNATENVFECLNVSSRFYHRALEVPVMVVGLAPNPPRTGEPTLPADARKILTQPAQRLDFTLTIDGYGSGQVAILLG